MVPDVVGTSCALLIVGLNLVVLAIVLDVVGTLGTTRPLPQVSYACIPQANHQNLGCPNVCLCMFLDRYLQHGFLH